MPSDQIHNLPQNKKRIAVVGGGISGLAAAHRLVELDSDIEIIFVRSEQSARWCIKNGC